jgi:L-seryl-tRNA(Ser) seleniumtransferase
VPERLAAALRTGAAPVVGRVHQGRLLLDLLALDPADDERLAGAVVEALGRTRGGAA